MATLGTLIVDLEANTAQFTSTLNSAQSKLASVGQKMTSIGKGLTAAVTLPLAAVGVAAVKMASDAAESASKFDTVFGTSAGVMSEFISGLQATVPGTTKQLQDMASGLQDLLVPMGVIPDKALKMNEQFLTLAGDLASFNNIPMEAAMEKIRAGLVGSSEPLLAFGIDVRQAAVQLKALELGLIKEGEEITNSVRAQAVLAIAMEQSEFAIGDAARTADSLANQFKFIKRDALELVQTIGGILIPIITPMIEAIGNALTKFRGMDSSMQTVIVTVGLVVAIIGPLLLGLGFIIPAIAAIGPVIAVIFGPVGAIVAAVAIIGTFVVTNETARKTLKEVWNKIKANMDKVLKSIKRLFETVSASFTKVWDKWGDSIEAIFKGIWDAIKGIIGPAFNLIGGVLSGALQVLSGLIAAFTGLITGDWTTFTDGIKTIWSGLWTAIKAAVTAPFEAIGNVVSGFTSGITGLFQGMFDAVVGSSIIPDMMGGIQTEFDRLGTDVQPAVSTDLGSIKTAFSGLSTDVAGESGIIPGMMTSINSSFTGLGTSAAGWFGETGTISGPMIGGFSGISDAVKNLTGKGVLGALGDKFNDLIAKIPGLGNIAGAFTGIISSVQGVIDKVGSLLDTLKNTLGGIASGAGVNVSFTTSFTELAITGVAIQTGIFGTGVAITGVTIQKGEFKTGVSFTGFSLKFGGGGDTKETAFNTRLTLAWIKDFFPVFNRSNDRSEGLLHSLMGGLAGIQAWSELGGLELVNIRNQMDTLISIQRDRIAPAVESIDSKTPIEINNVVNVTVSGGGGGQVVGPFPPMASKVGKQIGDQIIKTVKDGIATNKLGLRAALQKI